MERPTIVIPKLIWRGGVYSPALPDRRTNITQIALHHMAHADWSFYDVHDYHKNTLKWWGIAYGFWIDFNGVIYQGRGFLQNAGVKDQGAYTLDIGFQGNYHPHDKIAVNTVMPDAQFNSGVRLINWLATQLPNLKRIDGHGAFSPSSCPGIWFPLDEMKERKERGIKMSNKVPFKDVPEGAWYESTLERALKTNPPIISGYADGTIKPNAHPTRMETLTMIMRLYDALRGDKK